MRGYIKILIGSLLIGCASRQNDPKDAKDPSLLNTIKGDITLNDTFCMTDLSKFNSSKLTVLKICHIRLNQKISDSLKYLKRNGLLKDYNYGELYDLNFRYENDTLQLRKLYLVNNRNLRILPDTIFFRSDTLITGERGIEVANGEDFQDMKFEEVYYQILCKPADMPTSIYWNRNL